MADGQPQTPEPQASGIQQVQGGLSQHAKPPAEPPAEPTAEPPAEPNAAGEQPAAAPEDGKQGEQNTTPTTSSDFTLAVPEGAENYQEAITAYQGFGADWLKQNPNATAADALKAAYEWQVGQVGQQQERVVEQWIGQLKTDAEFGGDSYDQNVAIANKGIAAVGSKELISLLTDTGLGANPEVVKAFHKVGLMVKDDDVVKGDTATGRKVPTFTGALYGAKK